jgi:ribosomal protein S27AE
MIFYGVKEESVWVAEMGQRSCPNCGAWREFSLHLNYTYMHLYWIFGAVVKRKYLVACSACGRGTFVDKDQIGYTLDREPIPFLQRWGFALMLLTILTIITWVIVSGRND